jgi:hypothetical protein
MRLGSVDANGKGQKIVKKRTATKGPQLKPWARKIGKMTAQTEIAALEAKTELEARVRDFRLRQERALRRLLDLHRASRRALKEFRTGMRKAAAELEGAIRGTVGRNGIRAMARGKRKKQRCSNL